MAPGLELQPETRNKPSVLIIGAPLTTLMNPERAVVIHMVPPVQGFGAGGWSTKRM